MRIRLRSNSARPERERERDLVMKTAIAWQLATGLSQSAAGLRCRIQLSLVFYLSSLLEVGICRALLKVAAVVSWRCRWHRGHEFGIARSWRRDYLSSRGLSRDRLHALDRFGTIDAVYGTIP